MPRKSIFGENAQITTMRLYSWEKELVREFLKKIRQERKKKMEVKGEKHIKTRSSRTT